ncbi:MAG: nucleoside recognition domain-containing protein [Ruminococcus sp.]|nr:nucleoside recognition domain-containing protein [Ruminococcus sp.]
MSLSAIIVPLVICTVFVTALFKRVDIFTEFVKGAKENLLIAVDLIPPLVILLTAIEMLSASGVIEAISQLLSPLTQAVGFPKECTSLALIRPVSGSGALAVLESLFGSISPDSYAGRVASVLMGSSETTFYTIAVYYSAVRIKAEYKVFVSSLTADFTCFVFSALIVRLFY